MERRRPRGSDLSACYVLPSLPSVVAVWVKSAYLPLKNPKFRHFCLLRSLKSSMFLPVSYLWIPLKPLIRRANCRRVLISFTRLGLIASIGAKKTILTIGCSFPDSCIHLSTSYPWRRFALLLLLLLLHLLLLLLQHPHSFQVHVIEIYIVNYKVVENTDGRLGAHSS